jgi:hypothetical protein
MGSTTRRYKKDLLLGASEEYTGFICKAILNKKSLEIFIGGLYIFT